MSEEEKRKTKGKNTIEEKTEETPNQTQQQSRQPLTSEVHWDQGE